MLMLPVFFDSMSGLYFSKVLSFTKYGEDVNLPRIVDNKTQRTSGTFQVY